LRCVLSLPLHEGSGARTEGISLFVGIMPGPFGFIFSLQIQHSFDEEQSFDQIQFCQNQPHADGAEFGSSQL